MIPVDRRTMIEKRDSWDIEKYQKLVNSLPKAGTIALTFLQPNAGEKILDLGCGEGTLTEKIQSMGCHTLGIDSSPKMIKACASRNINVQLMDARFLKFDEEFDAVFSHASLHWMNGAEMVVKGVAKALKNGGRFIAECGGIGNVSIIESSLINAVINAGFDAHSPWYNLDETDYKAMLESHGLKVEFIHLIPIMEPLRNGIRAWLEIFAHQFLIAVPHEMHSHIFDEAEKLMRPLLCNEEGMWHADYVRLSVKAIKTPVSA